MRDTERRARLNRAIVDLTAFLADQGLPYRIREAQGGYPSTTYGQMTSRSDESPVEANLGLRTTGTDPKKDKDFRFKSDPATADLRLMDELVKRACDCLQGLDDLRRKYPTPRPGTAAQGEEADGCEICWRQKVWNATKGEPSDLAGLLPRKYALCSTCERMCLNLGGLPLPHQWRAAHETGRVKVRAK